MSPDWLHQGNSVRIQPLVDSMPTIQDEILAHFADARVFSQCPSCSEIEILSSSPSTSIQSPFRCDDCGYLPPCCRACIVRRHRHQPLHRIEEWSGGFFHRCNNAELGISLYLGHAGARCPHLPKAATAKRSNFASSLPRSTIHR
jgi:predicted RNA-binding Zn-ribbon protein involved in translation (DUF1610 family)